MTMLDPIQTETLAEEFGRLVREYREPDTDGTQAEAWNLIADFAVENADVITRALSTITPAEVGGLVERLRKRADTMNGAAVDASDGATYTLGYYDQFVAADDREAATAIEAQAARIAALEAERDGWFQATKSVFETGSIVPTTGPTREASRSEEQTEARATDQAYEMAVSQGEAGYPAAAFRAGYRAALEAKEAELAAVKAERDALRVYAHESTKVITSIAGGGSELFGRQIGDVWTADLAYCDKVIRERRPYKVEVWKERNLREDAEAQRDEALKALDEADRILRDIERHETTRVVDAQDRISIARRVREGGKVDVL